MSAQGEIVRPVPIRALARPRFLAIVCIAVLAAAGWTYLGFVLAGPGQALQALCRPVFGLTGSFSLPGALLTLAMWCAMVLAMMLPTAAPMVTVYTTLTETAGARGEPAASPLVLTAGYVAVWIGVAIVLTTLQILLARTAVLDPDMRIASSFLAGAMFLAAGAYQFSDLKRACLTHCQHPFRFFFANWSSDPRQIFQIGLRQGLYCVGCCWALMLLMFAVGVMNVIWMAVLGAIMATEKLGVSMRFSRVVGVMLVGIGLAIIAEIWIIGWPRAA